MFAKTDISERQYMVPFSKEMEPEETAKLYEKELEQRRNELALQKENAERLQRELSEKKKAEEDRLAAVYANALSETRQLQGEYDPPLYTNSRYPIEMDAPRVTKAPADKSWTASEYRALEAQMNNLAAVPEYPGGSAGDH